MLQVKQTFDNAKAVMALLSALESSEGPDAIDAYQIVEVIKALQNKPDVNNDDLFRVEWAYLPLFDQHRDASPKLLEWRLANDPKFFCEVIRLVFKSKREDLPDEKVTKKMKYIETNAYHLLDKCRIPPGSREDGSYDGNALKLWLGVVKKECTETGHLEIAMTMVGHMLVHVPPDPDGLWIHHSAAKVLNAKDAQDMRQGFRTELYNSRGVHLVEPTGKQERELAARYDSRAEAVENAGYTRLASTLHELASSYKKEAEWVSSRDSFDD
jgi:hypothetical protein